MVSTLTLFGALLIAAALTLAALLVHAGQPPRRCKFCETAQRLHQLNAEEHICSACMRTEFRITKEF